MADDVGLIWGGGGAKNVKNSGEDSLTKNRWHKPVFVHDTEFRSSGQVPLSLISANICIGQEGLLGQLILQNIQQDNICALTLSFSFI